MKYSLLKLSALAAIMNPAHAAFHKDALVSTSDGTRPMSQLKVGQRVRSLSRNGTVDKAMVIGKSLADQTNSIMEIELGKKHSKRTIKAMPNQQLFDVGSKDWVRAKDLTADHILLGEDGSPINIHNVQKKRRNSFSFPHHVSVDEEHNLFVDGVLCHNMDWLREVAVGIEAGTSRVIGVVGAVLTARDAYQATAPVREVVAERLHVKQEQREARAARHAEARARRMAEQERQRIEEQTSKVHSTLSMPPMQIVPDSFCDHDHHGIPPVFRDAGVEIVRPATPPVPASSNSGAVAVESDPLQKREVKQQPPIPKEIYSSPPQLPNYNPVGRGQGWMGPQDPSYVSPEMEAIARVEHQQYIDREEARIQGRSYQAPLKPGDPDRIICGFGGRGGDDNSIDNHDKVGLSPVASGFVSEKEAYERKAANQRAEQTRAAEQSEKSLPAAAPKRRINQANVDKFRRVIAQGPKIDHHNLVQVEADNKKESAESDARCRANGNALIQSKNESKVNQLVVDPPVVAPGREPNQNPIYYSEKMAAEALAKPNFILTEQEVEGRKVAEQREQLAAQDREIEALDRAGVFHVSEQAHKTFDPGCHETAVSNPGATPKRSAMAESLASFELKKATPEEIEGMNKMFGGQGNAQDIGIASALRLSQQYGRVHAQIPGAAPRPVTEVNRAVAHDVKRSILPDLLTMPPSVAVSFLAHTQRRADETHRSQIRAGFEQEMRRIEEQARYSQVRNAETAQKSESTVKTHKERIKGAQNVSFLRDSLFGIPKK